MEKYKILLTEMGNVHKINPNYLMTTHNYRDIEYQPIDMDETCATRASKSINLKKFITCHIKQWPDYWLAELPDSLLNCSRHDMVTARLISEHPGSTVSFSKTVALLEVHPELQSLWTFLKWTVNAWQFVCAVLPTSSTCLFTYVPTTSM